MTAQQFFGALVRASGLYWFMVGMSFLFSALTPSENYTPVAYVIHGAPHCFAGIFLMLKADPIVEMCYSKTDDEGYPES